jgi:hypothetical protein
LGLPQKYWQSRQAHLLTQPACLVGLPCWPAYLTNLPALSAQPVLLLPVITALVEVDYSKMPWLIIFS